MRSGWCRGTLPLWIAGVLSLAPSAWAQAEGANGAAPARPADTTGPATIALDVAPVAPPIPRTYHVHDGFYLRANLGFGTESSSFNDGKAPNLDYSAHGGSMAFDLLVGGSPSPGVSIGGALFVEPLLGGSYDYSGVSAGNHSLVSSLIGPFIDGFPDAVRGLHLGATIGLASQSFKDLNANGASSRSVGIGGATWLGYDFWVGDEWAMGPELRLMGMRTTHSSSSSDIAAWARSISVCFSAVYN